jgi:hypothetical protein
VQGSTSRYQVTLGAVDFGISPTRHLTQTEIIATLADVLNQPFFAVLAM